jgi:hypothetical protein
MTSDVVTWIHFPSCFRYLVSPSINIGGAD